MPDINEHMDELFKKAGEHYPLKTSSADFDKVLAALAGDTVPLAAAKPTGRKRYLLLLLIGFMLGAGTIGIYFYSNNLPGNTVSSTTQTPKNEGSTSTAGKQVLPAANNKRMALPNATVVQPNLTGSSTPVDASITQSVIARHNKQTLLSTTPPAVIASQQQPTFSPVIVTEKERHARETTIENIPANTSSIVAATSFAADSLLTEKTSTVLPNAVANLALNKKTTAKQSTRKKIYIGLTAGVEFNEVKQQGITRPSMNAGLLVGWQVKPKLALESGLDYSQKKYFSQGKYFTPESGSMPGGMQINSLNGKVSMVELPLNIKYDLRKNWYARAGVSSYLMMKEENKYDALMYGQPEKIVSTYDKNKTYLASMFNISAGYQQQLNKKHTLRIEPYVQVPLKGMGVGYMPVSSAGLHIIVTQ